MRAISPVPQHGRRQWCPLRAKEERSGLRAQASRGTPPRSPDYGSRKQRLHPQGVGTAWQLAPGQRGPGRLARQPYPAQRAPGPTVPDCTADGRRWRAALDADLAAAAPVLRARTGGALNRTVALTSGREGGAGRTCGIPRVGRAGGGLPAGQGSAEAQAARATERPTSGPTCAGSRPEPLCPPATKSPCLSHQLESSRSSNSSWVKCGGYPQKRLDLNLHRYFSVPRTSGSTTIC